MTIETADQRVARCNVFFKTLRRTLVSGEMGIPLIVSDLEARLQGLTLHSTREYKEAVSARNRYGYESQEAQVTADALASVAISAYTDQIRRGGIPIRES